MDRIPDDRDTNGCPGGKSRPGRQGENEDRAGRLRRLRHCHQALFDVPYDAGKAESVYSCKGVSVGALLSGMDDRIEGVVFVAVRTEGAGYVTPASLEELHRSLETALVSGPELLVLTGREPGRFGLGLDPARLRESLLGGEGFLEPLQAAAMPVFEFLGNAPVPTLALLDGPALGASLTLALACDARFAPRSEQVVLGYPELALGLMPVLGGTVFLTRVVGPGRTVEILAGGRKIGPAPARSLGLVDEVFEAASLTDGGLRQQTVQWARDHAGRLAGWRAHPRRYPQGRTWLDLFTERTRPGRRLLLRRLRSKLSEARLPLDPLQDIYPAIEASVMLTHAEALNRARQSAVVIAGRKSTAERLDAYADRERERRQERAPDQAAGSQSESSG
ncbi:enoyl-CoA hydratase/isomerase family protein [Gemmatimonadota bacterium]